MFVETVEKSVKRFFKDYEESETEDKIQVLIIIFEEWSNNQINDLNEANPDLLDDEVDIKIFNPESIGLQKDFGIILAQYLFVILQKEKLQELKSVSEIINLSTLINYTDNSEELISMFERLSFMEKLDVIAEMVIGFENLEIVDILSDNDLGCGYDIASSILEYKKNLKKEKV